MNAFLVPTPIFEANFQLFFSKYFGKVGGTVVEIRVIKIDNHIPPQPGGIYENLLGDI